MFYFSGHYVFEIGYFVLIAHLLQTGHVAGLTGHTWLVATCGQGSFTICIQTLCLSPDHSETNEKPEGIYDQQELSKSSR